MPSRGGEDGAGTSDRGGSERPSQEPLRSDARRNRDRVLDAAIDVLSHDPAATVEDVAAAAEVARSTVYRRFRSRPELLQAVRERLVDETRSVFKETLEREPDFRSCMDATIREAVRVLYRRRLIWRHLEAAGVMPNVESYRPKDTFVEWLEAGQRDGELRDDVPVDWLVTTWMQLVVAGAAAVARGIDLEEAARLAADTAARALRAD